MTYDLFFALFCYYPFFLSFVVEGILALTMVTMGDRYFAVPVLFIGFDAWDILLSPCRRGDDERGSAITSL